MAATRRAPCSRCGATDGVLLTTGRCRRCEYELEKGSEATARQVERARLDAERRKAPKRGR